MTERTSPNVGSVSPYTYQNRNGKAKEVLLLPLSVDEVGTGAEYPPPQFDLETLSSWMRQRYFFFEGQVIAQIPRRSGEFPLRCNDEQVTDITCDEEGLYVYYPVTEDKAVCAWWEYRVDEWDIDLIDQPSADEHIIVGEGHSRGTDLVWSWRTRGE